MLSLNVQDYISKVLELIRVKKLKLIVKHANESKEKERFLHCHGHYEVFVQIDGKTEFHLAKKKLILNENEVLILSPNVSHREKAINNKKGSFLNLVVSVSLDHFAVHLGVKSESSDKPKVGSDSYLCHELNREKKDLIQMMCSEAFKDEDQHIQLQLFSVFCEMLLKKTKNRLKEVSYKNEFVQDAIRYIDEYYTQEDCDLIHIAKRIGCSPNYLSALFNKEVSVGLNHYVNQKRLHRAKRILKGEHAAKIIDIGKRCGFEESSYFIRKFKNEFGMTPRKYRMSEIVSR